MDYQELIENLKRMLPEKVLYGDLIGAEGVYAHSGPLVYEDPEPYFIEQAITAITELLARAEAAEAGAEAAEKKAADVRPMVRGQWKWFEDWTRSTPEGPSECMDAGWYCAHCGYVLNELGIYFDDLDNPPKLNFCPNCGADMKGE